MAKVEAPDLTVYATKPPSAMHVRFAEWIEEETGYTPSAEKTKDAAFLMGVALGAYLRPTFQRSEANHDAWKDSGAKVPGIARKDEKAAPKKGKAAKAVPVVEDDDDDDDAEETAPPAKKATKATKAPAAAPKAATGGVRKATPTKARPGASKVDAPF